MGDDESVDMFSGITPQRLLRMTPQERRWLDNIKKAFYDSDCDYAEGHPEDRCLQELCIAIDTAKTLRRSLRGEDTSPTDNRARFLEFLNLEIPPPKRGGTVIELLDARSGKKRTYSLPELVYDIRCMVHENENLNVEERTDYHILIDWKKGDRSVFGYVAEGRLVCNGNGLWRRLRQVLAGFITGVEGMIALASQKSGGITIEPPICSLLPDGRTHRGGDALANLVPDNIKSRFKFFKDPKTGDYTRFHLYCYYKTENRAGAPETSFHKEWLISDTRLATSSNPGALMARRRKEEEAEFVKQIGHELAMSGQRLVSTEEGLVRVPISPQHGVAPA